MVFPFCLYFLFPPFLVAFIHSPSLPEPVVLFRQKCTLFRISIKTSHVLLSFFFSLPFSSFPLTYLFHRVDRELVVLLKASVHTVPYNLVTTLLKFSCPFLTFSFFQSFSLASSLPLSSRWPTAWTGGSVYCSRADPPGRAETGWGSSLQPISWK